MAFVVEDGSGVKNANSYATVQEFRDYHTERGRDVSGLTDDNIQYALILATDYIDFRWGPLFLGNRRWESLLSRGTYSLSSQPVDGDTVTFGDVTYTFRDDPSQTDETEIGTTILKTIANLADVIVGSENDDVTGAEFPNPDLPFVVIFATMDGIALSSTVGTWSESATSGFSGLRQPLEFPRSELRDRNGEWVTGVPLKLRQGTHEYAWRAKDVSLAPDPSVDPTGARVTRTRNKVGPIETETEFAEEGIITELRPFPSADRLLREFVRVGGVIRA